MQGEDDFICWVKVSENNIEEIKDILGKHDGLEFFYPNIAPKIVETHMQKKAILLALASHWDEFGDRWRIHVLMYGKDSSGTAKTPLLRFLETVNGGFTGMRSTEAGLTVNLKDGSKGFHLRPAKESHLEHCRAFNDPPIFQIEPTQHLCNTEETALLDRKVLHR